MKTPVPCPYKRTKQSANLLGGYLMAAAATRRYVFMVEEDVMVARDFLPLALRGAGEPAAPVLLDRRSQHQPRRAPSEIRRSTI